jgi:hypothetical protein
MTVSRRSELTAGEDHLAGGQRGEDVLERHHEFCSASVMEIMISLRWKMNTYRLRDMEFSEIAMSGRRRSASNEREAVILPRTIGRNSRMVRTNGQGWRRMKKKKEEERGVSGCGGDCILPRYWTTFFLICLLFKSWY